MTTVSFDDASIRTRFSDAYDGTLDGAERSAFDAHLARSSAAADDYASFVAALAALAHAQPREVPDAHLSSVLAAVGADLAGPAFVAPRTGRTGWNIWTHAAAAVLGAAACLAVVVNMEADTPASERSRATLVDAVPSTVEEPVAAATAPASARIATADTLPAATSGIAEPVREPISKPVPPADIADPRTSHEVTTPAAHSSPTPLIAVHLDGRRLVATWAGVRDDIADLLAASPRAPALARPEPTARVPAPARTPAPTPTLIADAAPDFEWPAELRETTAPDARASTPARASNSSPWTSAAAAATLVVATAAPVDGVRLLAIDNEVAALRTSGTLVDVVPNLISHLGEENDPASTMAADQLSEIAAQLADNPMVGPRLRTPRYAQPKESNWWTGWLGDDTPEPYTHDGSLMSFWTAWHEANAPLLAELARSGEA